MLFRAPEKSVDENKAISFLNKILEEKDHATQLKLIESCDSLELLVEVMKIAVGNMISPILAQLEDKLFIFNKQVPGFRPPECEKALETLPAKIKAITDNLQKITNAFDAISAKTISADQWRMLDSQKELFYHELKEPLFNRLETLAGRNQVTLTLK